MNLAHRIKAISEIKGKFTLRSGQISNIYFDKYKFESEPSLLNEITKEMARLIPAEIEVLCGLEMGGIPIVTILSQHTKLPAAFIRKSPKEHGTCKYAEGADISGKRIILVEDVVSSGGAIIDASRMLKRDGINVDLAICVIDRETGGKEKLAENGIELISLFKFTDFNKSAQQVIPPEPSAR